MLLSQSSWVIGNRCVNRKGAEAQRVTLFSPGHNQPNGLADDFKVDPEGPGFNIFQIEI